MKIYFRLFESDADLTRCHVTYDVNSAIMIYDNCKFGSFKATGFVILRYQTKNNPPFEVFVSEEMDNLGEKQIELIKNFSIYLLLNDKYFKYNSTYVKNCLDFYYDSFCLDDELNQNSEEYYENVAKINQPYPIKYFNHNIIEVCKLVKTDNPHFKNFLHLVQQTNKKQECSLNVGLCLSLRHIEHTLGLLTNAEIIPVLVDLSTKRPKVKNYFNAKETAFNIHNEELTQFANLANSMVYNQGSICKTNREHYAFMADSYWSLLFSLPTELRYFSINKSYYPIEYSVTESCSIIFKCISERNNTWYSEIILKTKSITITGDSKDRTKLIKTLNHFGLVEIMDKTAQIIELTNDRAKQLINAYFSSVPSSYQDLLEFVKYAQKLKIANLEISIENKTLNCADFLPIPSIFVRKEGTFYSLKLFFDYNPAKNPNIDKTQQIERFVINKEFEQACKKIFDLDELIKHHPYNFSHNISEYFDMRFVTVYDQYCLMNYNVFPKWLATKGKEYIELGFLIFTEFDKRHYKKSEFQMDVRIKQTSNWLEFKPIIINEKTGEAVDIKKYFPESMTIEDKKGNIHQVTAKNIEQLELWRTYGQLHTGGFRVPINNTSLIKKVLEEEIGNRKEFKDIATNIEKLNSFKKIKNYPIAKGFIGKLRNYQKAGYDWLNFLREFNFNGCLADDMGLGKTVQTLAFLQNLKEKKTLKTSLLVVPLSSIPNWQDEINKFTPDMKYYCIHGVANFKLTELKENQLIITSYATLRQKIKSFIDFPFDYIILDESQNIKNYTTQTAKAIKSLKSVNRLALSGTPIENNLTELWSLFDYLNPGFLGNIEFFKEKFLEPIVKDKNKEVTESLKKSIFPFMLRRKKQDVEIDLPEKNEIIQHVEMDKELEKAYYQLAKYFREKISEEIETQGMQKSSNRIFEGMLRLRQLCLFPELAGTQFKQISSPKFDFLTDLLDDVLKEEHKLLIFSQFTSVLDIIGTYLQKEKLDYLRIDGSSTLKQREKSIKEFQNNPDKTIFLLSLKAGGVALNLTAADYVIIFDPWWNPAVEAQAVDRAHRIGQTRKVISYRIIVKNSIEDKILKLQETKKELMNSLITEDTSLFKSLSKEELLNLFS